MSDRPKLLSAAILSSTTEFRVETPTVLFDKNFVGWRPGSSRSNQVAKDNRFLMFQEAGEDDVDPGSKT